MSEHPDYHGLTTRLVSHVAETDWVYSCEQCGCQWITTVSSEYCPECGSSDWGGDADE